MFWRLSEKREEVDVVGMPIGRSENESTAALQDIWPSGAVSIDNSTKPRRQRKAHIVVQPLPEAKLHRIASTPWVFGRDLTSKNSYSENLSTLVRKHVGHLPRSAALEREAEKVIGKFEADEQSPTPGKSNDDDGFVLVERRKRQLKPEDLPAAKKKSKAKKLELANFYRHQVFIFCSWPWKYFTHRFHCIDP